MIKSNLKYAGKYAVCHSKFTDAFGELKRLSENFEVGEVNFAGLRFLSQSYQTKPESEKKLEVHRKFIDIQFIVDGEEKIYFGDQADFSVKIPYDEAKDAEFLQGNLRESTVLRANDFAVFFPEDAHKPGCISAKPSIVKKIVVKIPVE